MASWKREGAERAGYVQDTDSVMPKVPQPPENERDNCREVPDDDPYDFGCPGEAPQANAAATQFC